MIAELRARLGEPVLIWKGYRGYVANECTHQVRRLPGRKLYEAIDFSGKRLGTFKTLAQAKAACEAEYAANGKVAS